LSVKNNKINFIPEPIIIPAAKIRSFWEEIVDKARYAHQPYLITKRNKPAVVVIGVDDYEALIEKKITKNRVMEKRVAKTIENIRERNRDIPLEDVERDVAEAVKAVRKMYNKQ